MSPLVSILGSAAVGLGVATLFWLPSAGLGLIAAGAAIVIVGWR
jgi:hypothetical protein